MKRQKRKEAGITLIALVISIIVMLILAGVSINATVGDNGILKQAQLSSVMQKFAGYKEQLELNALEDEEIYASGPTIKNYIPNIEEQDVEKFVIMKRQLLYVENDKLEIEASKNVGIQTADTGEEGSVSAIEEVKAVISGVVDLTSGDADKYHIPEDDFDITTNTNDNSKGLIGTRLYDKNSVNSETWNIVIEYNNTNQEVARYGSGYYWLKAGETYIIDGKSIKFQNNFIVDYANKSYIVLSGRAVNWNLNSTIAVSDGMVLNLDPMTLADGEWKANGQFFDFYVKDSRSNNEKNTGIQKTGDVKYDEKTKSLNFNENTNQGGYIKLQKEDISFKNGFTFEIYCNVNTLNGGKVGLFCRRPSLNSDFTRAMRFHRIDSDGIGRFGPKSEIYYPESQGKTGKLYTRDDGFIHADSDFYGWKEQEDFYMTVVYRTYSDKYADEVMKDKKVDRYEYYLNGKLVDYTYYGHNCYEEGRKIWDTNDNYFFIGVCCWASNTGNYYLNGKVYTTRLYTQPMTEEQVKDNYDTTLKYRSSF